ncbi:beta-glucanase (GH16 family) [Algoriphagus sp. 4150]|uniref:glycoside hydrolase family 16 protein n=1 Tax=Algoriphagus sp. 4150 TaxID=2817756 RepID=UPI0028568255|nr:glycoside hydrolase family 16 protein [Algoriphagus sp. 4150]MDR7129546.1 beta-glucanase (GH16 family) [Algoriphagus sp. 4150]
MKISFSCVLFLSLAMGSCGSLRKEQAITPDLKGYTLLWADEFDTEGMPNPDFWSPETGFVRNNEMQWYQLENATVSEGNLVIEGRKEKVKNPSYDPASNDWRKNREFAEYTSSSINTRGKVEFQYAVVEVRAKIDTASGMWPAIWTLGVSKPWPANGEIDIMEFYKVDGKPTILANAAWAHEQKRARWDEAKIPFAELLAKDADWPSKFHIWKMDWTADYTKIYLDGELLNEVDLTQTTNPDGFNPFHQPHYLLLNLALGSNGGSLEQTPFPKQYQIDYVRVYQKK